MKKILLFLFIAAIALTSCNKEDSSEIQQEQVSSTFVFTSAKPLMEDGSGTKTEWTGSTIQWSANDQIRMAYTVAGVWQGANGSDNRPKIYASNKLEAATDVATFSVNTSFVGQSEGTHIFYGLYPSNLVGGTDFTNAPEVSINIPSEQTPKANSFDAEADVMVGVSEEFPAKPSAAILMRWTRKVAHADLKLNNLSIQSGETIQKIRLTAQEGADLVGTHNINLKTGEISNPAGATNTIVLNADNLTYSSNSVEFWASMLPATITELTVAVETDKAYYIRHFTGISREFKRNKRNTMNIGMGSAVREQKAYELETFEEKLTSSFGTFSVENESTLPSGLSNVWTIDNTYNCAKATAYVSGTRYAVTSYLISPELIIGSDNSTLTFEHAARYFNNSFGTFLSVVVIDGDTEETLSLNNQVPTGSDWAFVSVSVDLSAYKNRNIRIAFKYHSTTTIAPTWEVKNVKITDVVKNVPRISVTSANPMSVGKAGGSQTITYSIVNPLYGKTLTATSNQSWISNISVGESSITFLVAAQTTGAASRNGTITLSYDGASNVDVIVNQEAGTGGDLAANGWLELPAKQTGNDYFNDFFKVGSARNYSYMYQYSTYTSLWVAYPLYKNVMSTNTVVPGPYSPDVAYSEETRGTTWASNPHLAEGKQVNVWTYSYNVNYGDTYWSSTQGSDYYARGHQIPNADRSENDNMQTHTYYATNSTPQIQNKFNASIWAALEKAGRDCARGGGVNDTVYVVTGAAFNKIGENRDITYIHPRADENKNVPVPNYYWKVFLKVKRTNGSITSASAIGFWLEHKQYSGSDYTPYATSVNQIEAWTGFNFFVNLPSSLEETAEANTNWTTFKNF